MNAKKRVRVLVCEDSLFMQEVIRKTLQSDPGIEVIGSAKSGREAIKLAQSLRPDVVTLDVIMPDMDGLEILRHLVQSHVPVVVLSAVAQAGSTIAIQALAAGAVDCLPKPRDLQNRGVEFQQELVGRVKGAAIAATSDQLAEKAAAARKAPKANLAQTLVIIGASAGGPMLLREAIPKLPADLPAAVLVVQHLPSMFTKQLAAELSGISKMQVKEAQAGDVFIEGSVLIAPGDQILKVEWVKNNWGAVSYSNIDASVYHVRPWIDASMTTAAFLFGKRCLGVILSGMGSDGMEGMRKIREMGGVTIAQDESTSLVFGMPKAAIDAGVIDKILPISQIAPAIIQQVEQMAGVKK
ncbi:MAG: chemotaxis-specific protein-glutamate methyltransferase CheB [Elusimicrobia bacterium]|nr:chemotaxis-specific protein-glutamate methyltransferase CheB [Elusimicrobiota bacterium]